MKPHLTYSSYVVSAMTDGQHTPSVSATWRPAPSMRLLLGTWTLTLGILSLMVQSDAWAEQPPNSSGKQQIKVLGIGNSFTGNAFSLLQPMGQRCDNFEVILGQASIGGSPMEKHLRLARLHEQDPSDPEGRPYSLSQTDEQGKRISVKVGLKELLTSDRWDIVTIQQLSRQSPDVNSYRPYARELYNYIKSYAPQAEIVIHQTWAYRTDGDFDKVFPDKANYGQEEMYLDLHAAYTEIARELGVRVIPVGAAFQLAREQRPFTPDTATDRQSLTPPDLPHDKNSLCVGWRWSTSSGQPTLSRDTHHAGTRGKYLASAVWLEFLTGLNPHQEGITAGDISDEDAQFLSGIAHQVVSQGKRPKLETSRQELIHK